MEAWPTCREPVQGAGITETALGHGVPQVISLFLRLLLALCAQPTALQGKRWGKAVTAAWLKHEFFSLPKRSDKDTNSAEMALLFRFHSPMHKTVHSYQSKCFHSHFTWNVKKKRGNNYQDLKKKKKVSGCISKGSTSVKNTLFIILLRSPLRHRDQGTSTEFEHFWR